MKQKWARKPLILTAALLICCYTTVWLGMHGFYISLPVSVCLLLYTAYRIYRYILRSTRAMAQFIWSVRYSEFLSSPVQSEESLRSLPAELLNEMNQALDVGTAAPPGKLSAERAGKWPGGDERRVG